MLDIEFSQVSDPGRTRVHNEDYVDYLAPASPEEARSRGWLFALADGVGGHDFGEVASRAAVEKLISGFRQARGGEPHTALLPRLVQAANTHVFETAMATRKTGAPMATTLVTCALRFDRAVIAHVGDSRCYHVRNGQARQLTRDHTVANEQIRLGLIAAGEADGLPTSSILSRSLGNEMFVVVDSSEHHVIGGDVLLLCSDGLHHSIRETDIGEIVSHATDLQSAADKLVSIANQRDGRDNISVQLIRIKSVERVGMYRGRPYRLL
ncbi:MAG TPA: protein phosphatase 2C domain-containing protein [Bryobacteraceae bacterium]|nr:protein phosphatase 2C domain-containing protein [Bryobacteraceae bacterium]